jgi:hypothetical protein
LITESTAASVLVTSHTRDDPGTGKLSTSCMRKVSPARTWTVLPASFSPRSTVRLAGAAVALPHATAAMSRGVASNWWSLITDHTLLAHAG